MKTRLDLVGARALVTGASSGIGHATARALAERGASVAIAARRADRLEELAEVVAATGAPRPIVIVADLGKRGEAANLGKEALRALGGLDLLVNNAAMHELAALEHVGDGTEARSIYETNLWSPLALAVEVLPALRAGRPGAAIVNVTSGSAYMFPTLHGAYASSKAAFAVMTEMLHLEIGQHGGVHVVEAIPGPVDTAMLSAAAATPFSSIILKVMRPGSPEGMAQAMIGAVEGGRTRVVYPWHMRPPVALPLLGRWTMRALTRQTGSGVDIQENP